LVRIDYNLNFYFYSSICFVISPLNPDPLYSVETTITRDYLMCAADRTAHFLFLSCCQHECIDPGTLSPCWEFAVTDFQMYLSLFLSLYFTAAY